MAFLDRKYIERIQREDWYEKRDKLPPSRRVKPGEFLDDMLPPKVAVNLSTKKHVCKCGAVWYTAKSGPASGNKLCDACREKSEERLRLNRSAKDRERTARKRLEELSDTQNRRPATEQE